MYIFRSNLYINGVKVVNNDYPQGAQERCGAAGISLAAGNHTLYVEGWSRNSVLSIAATYQGPDTSSQKIVLAGYYQCPALENEPGVFTICGFKADSSVNLNSWSDLYTYYNQVFSFFKICIGLSRLRL